MLRRLATRGRPLLAVRFVAHGPQGVALNALTVAAIKETFPLEKRVALTPENVKALKAAGYAKVVVEKGLGLAAEFPDSEYVDSGAEIVDSAKAALSAGDVILKLRPPTVEEAKSVKENALYLGFVYDKQNEAAVKELAAKKATVLAVDRVPRTISKAQAFDAMTSQLGISGYRAVIEAANAFGRPLAGKMTMAGKIPPAKILVVGAAVAGLEAISCAKNMGAQVFATDTRPEAKDEVVAAGGKFVEPAGTKSESGTGGYAKEQTADYYAAAEKMYEKLCKDVDIVITTALIPGRPAPKIIKAAHVASMRRGSVTVDMAAEQGGNIETTKKDQVHLTENGVKCLGYTDLPSRLAQQSSKLYSNNLVKLLNYMTDKNLLKVNMEEEVTRCTALIEKGTVLPLQLGPPPAPPKKEEAIVAPPVDHKAIAVSRVASASIAFGFLTYAACAGPVSFMGGLSVFVLATTIGYYVVWGVTAALHSPLMSVTNAISGLVVVGGMCVAGGGLFPHTIAQGLAGTAVGLACINIFGGFRITQRMLDMFRRPNDPPDYAELWLYPALIGGFGLVLGHVLGVAQVVPLGYLMGSTLCIFSLAALSSQTTARIGVPVGAVGVFWGVLAAGLKLSATLPAAVFGQMAILGCLGGATGLYIAEKISPMDLPQLVAAFHSLVGFAAVLVCIASHLATAAHIAVDPMASIHIAAIYWGSIIGGITFTGSIVAFLKLDGRLRSGALQYPGRDQVNMAMLALALVGYVWYACTLSVVPLVGISLVSFGAGWNLVDAVGGADMPVCITVLNSYSGWALVAEGFLLDNLILTAVGCLIGSSGAILTYIMCVAMNRSIWNVLFGSYADLGGADDKPITGTHKEISVAECVKALVDAKEVMIVPGFGLCQGRAQYAIAEMATLLNDNGVRTRFGIHPVAGRMPGQLNVLLAEASVPYDIVHEMDEINHEFKDIDVALVVGANDVVNPDALENPKSALAGMPVLHVWKAKISVVMKRSMATGYAGVQNPLFFKENNYMLFGDAKPQCEALRNGVKQAFGGEVEKKEEKKEKK